MIPMQPQLSPSSPVHPHVPRDESFSQPQTISRVALGFSRRLPQGTKLSAGCGRNWMNLCGARN